MSRRCSALYVAALSLLPTTAYSAPSALREIPASSIITKTWINQHQQIGETGVCAAFINRFSVAAIRVEFLYSLIAKDGKVQYSMVHEAAAPMDMGSRMAIHGRSTGHDIDAAKAFVFPAAEEGSDPGTGGRNWRSSSPLRDQV
jgi:hypothetical protein